MKIPSLSRYSTLLQIEKCRIKLVKNDNRGKDGEKVVESPSLSRYSTLLQIEKCRTK